MSIEMHCHTLFSVDGQGTPEYLVDVAAERGVTVLAVTEHNHLGSQCRAKAQADRRGLRYINGIELDARWQQTNYHFLGFGFDADHPALRALVDRQHALYARRFTCYLECFERLGYRPMPHDALVEELAEALPGRYPSHPAPVPNQWACCQFLIDTGVFTCSEDVAAYHGAIDRANAMMSEDERGVFCDFEEARDTIQQAGGILLLAHVGLYFKDQSPEHCTDTSLALIRDMMSCGLDGFEIYHPANALLPGLVEDLKVEAHRTGCTVSGGSDCHHAPGARTKAIGSSLAPPSIVERIDAVLTQRRTHPS